MTSTQTIGVIGAGIMGTGIAQACVVAGLPVVMIDLDEERITRGRHAIASGLARLVEKSKLAAADRHESGLEPNRSRQIVLESQPALERAHSTFSA